MASESQPPAPARLPQNPTSPREGRQQSRETAVSLPCARGHYLRFAPNRSPHGNAVEQHGALRNALTQKNEEHCTYYFTHPCPESPAMRQESSKAIGQQQSSGQTTCSFCAVAVFCSLLHLWHLPENADHCEWHQRFFDRRILVRCPSCVCPPCQTICPQYSLRSLPPPA